MNFPILSAIIFIPLVGAFFIFFTKGVQKVVEKNSKYVAIFSSIANFFLSLFLWYSFDNSTSDFQFVEEKSWIEGFINFQLGIDGISILFILLTTLAPVAIAFLQPYQKLRILTFFNPELDPLGAGYQIIQSKIAVGSGGVIGKGFLQGTQSYLDYLPEKHTDFIFTLFSEEFGFVGSTLLLLLYIGLFFVIINIGRKARSYFAKYYCFGFASSLFIYVAVNMCEPLVSYFN